MGHLLIGGWIVLVVLWAIAHMLSLGPVEDAAQLGVTWLAVIVAGSAIVASLTVLGFGLVHGRSSPAWLRFVAQARTVAAVLGCGLIVIGLLHYRDTEPRSDISWLVAGLLVLVGSGIVHGWLALTVRRNLT